MIETSTAEAGTSLPGERRGVVQNSEGKATRAAMRLRVDGPGTSDQAEETLVRGSGALHGMDPRFRMSLRLFVCCLSRWRLYLSFAQNRSGTRS